MSYLLVIPQITDISRLQSALTWWEYADYAATLVVFIGVSGELLAGFTNVFKTKDNKVREKRVTLIFTVVLLVGLAGELTALVQTSNVTSKITEILRNDIAAAYKSAADATIEAGKANERGKELENQNLKLAIKLEEEKEKRLEIERKLAPRFLASRQRAAMLWSLRAHANYRITITRLLEAEAGSYADQISDVFKDAKWDVQFQYIGTLSPPVYGLQCKISSRPDSACEAVRSAFARAGIRLTLVNDGTLRNNVELLIGLKPPYDR